MKTGAAGCSILSTVAPCYQDITTKPSIATSVQRLQVAGGEELWTYVFALIFFSRILTKLLEKSADPTILAVAAHDTGEYVRHYPRGKQ